MRLSLSILIVCGVIYFACSMVTQPPERRMWVVIPGLIGFFGMLIGFVGAALCAVWSIR